MPTMMKACPKMDETPKDGSTLALWASLAVSVLANVGAGLKYLVDTRSLQTKNDAARVDQAHENQVKSLNDRIDDTDSRLKEMTAAHRECEKNHATLAGRVGALEAQASECFEDRKVLRQELAAIRDRK